MFAISETAGIYQLDYHGLLYVGASRNIQKRVRDHLKRNSSSRWILRLADEMVMDFAISRQDAIIHIADTTIPSMLEVFNTDFTDDDLAKAEDRWISKLKPVLNNEGANGRAGGYKQKKSKGQGSLWLDYGQRLEKLKAENDRFGYLWQQTYLDDYQAEFNGLSIRSEQLCRSIARFYSIAEQMGLQAKADELVASGLSVNRLQDEFKQLTRV